MMNRNIYFTLASGRGKSSPGIRPNKDKMSRFQQMAVPLFKSGKIWFPEELKDSVELAEMLNELQLATVKGFKSKHDDQIDNISMLGEFNAWKPSEVSTSEHSDGSMLWDDEPEDVGESSYFV
jgi:phage terminase large subunit-like protein